MGIVTHATRTGGPISGHKPWPAVGQPTEQNREPAPRQEVTYRCARGHTTALVFAAEAEPPDSWDCRTCGRSAGLDGPPGDPAARKGAKDMSPWALLLERRSIPELEAALAERLAEIRQQRGAVA